MLFRFSLLSFEEESELASECALCFKVADFFTLQYSWMSNKIFVAVDVVLKAMTLGSLEEMWQSVPSLLEPLFRL